MVTPPMSLVDLVGAGRASIPEAFAAQAHRRPRETFLIWQKRRWRYIDALDEVRRFAGLLESLGASDPGARVASYLTNQPAALWAWLGTLWIGGCYIPLNRQHRGTILEDMLRRARPRVLVTEREAIERLPALEPLGIGTVLLVDGDRGDARGIAPTVLTYESIDGAPSAEGRGPTPCDIGCVVYTSGTTGRSKAALVSHNQIVRGAARLVDAYGLRADDVFHNWLPLFHLGGLLHMTMTAIIAGGTVALFPTFSRRRFWSEVRETGATVLCGFSTILQLLWSLPASADDRESSLRIGIIAGIPPELHRRFEERFGLVIGENYGGTEADPLTAPDFAAPPPVGSFGRPTADFELAIVDAEDRPVAPGVIGEIVARPLVADVMFHGYEGDEAATVAAWRNLWHHTGDLGARDENGFFYYKGRLKHAIRRRGENISTFELDQILGTHTGIAECAAVGVPSGLGEEDVKVVLVAKSGCRLDPAEIRSFCAERMAGFMVPRYVEVRDALPYTELGKLEREQLREVTLETWDAESAGPTAGARRISSSVEQEHST